MVVAAMSPGYGCKLWSLRCDVMLGRVSVSTLFLQSTALQAYVLRWRGFLSCRVLTTIHGRHLQVVHGGNSPSDLTLTPGGSMRPVRLNATESLSVDSCKRGSIIYPVAGLLIDTTLYESLGLSVTEASISGGVPVQEDSHIAPVATRSRALLKFTASSGSTATSSSSSTATSSGSSSTTSPTQATSGSRGTSAALPHNSDAPTSGRDTDSVGNASSESSEDNSLPRTVLLVLIPVGLCLLSVCCAACNYQRRLDDKYEEQVLARRQLREEAEARVAARELDHLTRVMPNTSPIREYDHARLTSVHGAFDGPQHQQSRSGWVEPDYTPAEVGPRENLHEAFYGNFTHTAVPLPPAAVPLPSGPRMPRAPLTPPTVCRCCWM